MKSKLLLPATLIFLCACSQAGKDRDLNVVLAQTPPEAGYQLGGSIDSVEIDPEKDVLTAKGWHMLTPKTNPHELRIYMPGAESVLSVARMERPDVSAAVGDPDLLASGFEVRIKLRQDADIKQLCITVDDKHYGHRLLSPHTPDQARCAASG